MTTWTQAYISDFLSEIGGLFTSLMAGARFLIAGYNRFVADKSMLKRLYGEEHFDSADSQEATNAAPRDYSAKDTLRAKI